MAITIREVADAAGVSTATVSRALRGLAHVDPQTRERVERVARDLDYVMSPSASRLASGRTGTIAVITPFISRWFFSTVLSGVQDVLRDSDIDLLVFEVGDPTSIPPEQRLRGRVDGLLVISLPTDESVFTQLWSWGMPMSLIGSVMAGIPCVAIDDVAAARMATAHLVELGHRRIGMITGHPDSAPSSPAGSRHRGFREALADAGAVYSEESVGYGYFSVDGGAHAMDGLLEIGEPPTAVFAASDEMAFGAIRALQRRGMHPGRDVAVIGMDGHDLSEVMNLSTVAQPVRELGRIATDSLLVQVGLPAAERDEVDRATIVDTTLIVRGSTVPDSGGAPA